MIDNTIHRRRWDTASGSPVETVVQHVSLIDDRARTITVTTDAEMTADEARELVRDLQHAIALAEQGDQPDEPREFSDPDVEPPADVKQLTDHTGDLLVRLADNTWLWARIGTVDHEIDDHRNGYDWPDLVNELPEGAAFTEVKPS